MKLYKLLSITLVLLSSNILNGAYAYNESDALPTSVCRPPVNIQYMYEPDMTQLTFGWEAPPPTSSPVLYYEIADSENNILFQGTSPTDRWYQDQNLPGEPGKYLFYFYTVCAAGTSAAYGLSVTMT